MSKPVQEQEKTTVYRIEAHLSAGNTGDPMVSAVARAVGNFLFRKPLETQVLTFEVEAVDKLMTKAYLDEIAKEIRTGHAGLPVEKIIIREKESDKEWMYMG